jgi:tripartite-type tricarboxylate transporter receptor subunit TctC
VAVALVVPFGAGGAADRVARAVARSLDGDGTLAVENVPGEGGYAGVRRANALAANAGAPVLLLATPSTHVLLPARLGPQAAPCAAFEPLLGLGSAPNVLLVSPRLGLRTVDELVARARKGDLVYGSAGAGQTIHLCTALFCEQAGVRMRHRPFDTGSAGAYPELAAGTVDVYFDSALACREAVARGDAVALAVSSARRSALMPRLPTLAECGFPAHALDVWFGLFGADLDASWRARIAGAPGDAGLRSALAALGLAGGVTTAGELSETVAKSAAVWNAVRVLSSA